MTIAVCWRDRWRAVLCNLLRVAMLIGEGVFFMEAAERFWERVSTLGINDCWLWTGGLHVRGYGRTRYNGQPELAHRVAWMLIRGLIPPCYEIVQICGNKLCCNVAHLVVRPDKQQSQAYLHRQIDRLTARIEKLEAERSQIAAQIAQCCFT